MTEPIQPLRVLSFGAGAIGTYICGSLALKNHRVVFLERPEVAESLNQSSFSIETKDGVFKTPPITVTGFIEEALSQGPFDVAIFALKSFDSEKVLSTILGVKDLLPPILSLQNGVANEEKIAELIGSDKVIYGTVTTAIGKAGPGKIKVEKLRGLGIAQGHPLSERLVTAFSDAGLNAQLFPDAASMKWSKMLTNLIANASSAILNLPPGAIFADPNLYKVEILMLRETLRVMEAQSISVVNLPSTPVKALAWAINSLPIWLSRPLLHQAVGKGRGDKMPSFHIDLHGGRGASEVAYLNGAVADAGKSLGIPTPVNAWLNKTLLQLTTGEQNLESYQDPKKYYHAVIESIKGELA